MKERNDMTEPSMNEMKIIAHIHTDFPSKFGIPRQSGLADTKARIVFTPEYRSPEALRGIEEYSHLWLIWCFSEAVQERWHPMVRPPRLGGNTRVGVFATRSPYRPNPLGLSSVELLGIEEDRENGLTLLVKGADLLDGTPIYDIKPYLPYVDSHPEATGGFAERAKEYQLTVAGAEEAWKDVPEEKREALCQILAQDPRPSYQEDPARIYGMEYAGLEVKFCVKEGRLTVVEIVPT